MLEYTFFLYFNLPCTLRYDPIAMLLIAVDFEHIAIQRAHQIFSKHVFDVTKKKQSVTACHSV